MITEYKRKGFKCRVVGVLLFVCACLIGCFVPANAPTAVSLVLGSSLLAGIILVVAGLCYYAKAKGYSAVWGLVLPFTCIGLLVLVLLPDKAEDDPSGRPPQTPFPKQLATASLSAPLLAFIIGVFLQPQVRGNRIGMIILGSISTLFLIAGFIFGIIALVATRRCGREGIFGKALAGTIINGFFVLGMFLSIPLFLAVKGHTYTHRYTDLQASRTTHTCRKNGVRFSYYSDWWVEETLGSGNRAPSLEVRGPYDAVVILAFFPPGNQETLVEYANRIAQEQKAYLERQVRSGPVDMKIEPVVGRVGGAERAGFQAHFAGHTVGRTLSYDANYFAVSDPKHKIMVSTTVADEDSRTADPEIELILNSIMIEGMAPANQIRQGVASANQTKQNTTSANASKARIPEGLNVKMILYKPDGASAVIGSKTVMAGDVLAGFRIIAIQKDSVVVQSRAGEKKVLHMGDNLK